jgi:hypothetical protein
MTTTTPGTGRTARLLAPMTKGDNAFNARDFAAVDAVHHPGQLGERLALAQVGQHQQSLPARVQLAPGEPIRRR